MTNKGLQRYLPECSKAGYPNLPGGNKICGVYLDLSCRRSTPCLFRVEFQAAESLKKALENEYLSVPKYLQSSVVFPDASEFMDDTCRFGESKVYYVPLRSNPGDSFAVVANKIIEREGNIGLSLSIQDSGTHYSEWGGFSSSYQNDISQSELITVSKDVLHRRCQAGCIVAIRV